MFLKVDSGKVSQSDDDIAYVSANEFEYNIADNIYDFILMMIPFTTYCEMAGENCNKEMIDKINNFSSDNQSVELPKFIIKKNLK